MSAGIAKGPQGGKMVPSWDPPVWDMMSQIPSQGPTVTHPAFLSFLQLSGPTCTMRDLSPNGEMRGISPATASLLFWIRSPRTFHFKENSLLIPIRNWRGLGSNKQDRNGEIREAPEFSQQQRRTVTPASQAWWRTQQRTRTREALRLMITSHRNNLKLLSRHFNKYSFYTY